MNYFAIICFVVGLLLGVGITTFGFWFGFKASYEIRQSKEIPESEEKGFFNSRKDPAEFELVDEKKS